MKMEKVELAFYEFDARDVITTSLPGLNIDPAINDTAVPVLWLDRVSVENFNAFSEDDFDLQLDNDSIYWAYSGAKFTSTVKVPNVGTFNVTTFTASNYKDNEPSFLNTMEAGDSKMYYMILDWLNGFDSRKTQ